MKELVIYVHGKGGKAEEEVYRSYGVCKLQGLVEVQNLRL